MLSINIFSIKLLDEVHLSIFSPSKKLCYALYGIFVTLTSYVSYSLKTSKITYLDEAFQFYSAIKSRGYYKMADKYASSVYSIY